MLRKIAVLSHGQFRRLIKPATRITGRPGAPPILEHGQPSSALFYLVSGNARVEKHDQSIVVGPGAFLGEISFLTHHAATATVPLDDGAEAIAWPRAALAALLAKDPALDIAIRGLLNHDLAGKVSAAPLAHAGEAAHRMPVVAG